MAVDQSSPDSPVITAAVVRIQLEELAAHLGTLESELDSGRRIELLRGEAVVAEVHAPEQSSIRPSARTMPDFAAQRRKIWGEEVSHTDTTAWIREDRDSRD